MDAPQIPTDAAQTARTGPVFICARLDPICAVQFNRFISRVFENYQVKLDPIHEYHCTILVDKKGLSAAIPMVKNLFAIPDYLADGFGYEFRYMGSPTIALMIEQKFLRKLHRTFYPFTLSRGTFSSFAPHVTIGKLLPGVQMTRLPTNVRVPLRFSHVDVEPFE